jgi:hypothetical protein
LEAFVWARKQIGWSLGSGTAHTRSAWERILLREVRICEFLWMPLKDKVAGGLLEIYVGWMADAPVCVVDA